MTWIPSLNLSLINNPPTNSGSYSVHKMMLRKEPLGWMECFTFLWKTALCWLNFLCTGSLDFRSIVLDKSNAMFETWKTKFTFCFYGIILSQQHLLILIFTTLALKWPNMHWKCKHWTFEWRFPEVECDEICIKVGQRRKKSTSINIQFAHFQYYSWKRNFAKFEVLSCLLMARWLSPLEHNV